MYVRKRTAEPSAKPLVIRSARMHTLIFFRWNQGQGKIPLLPDPSRLVTTTVSPTSSRLDPLERNFIIIRVCISAPAPLVPRSCVTVGLRRKFSPMLASFFHLFNLGFHGGDEGKATIISSATAKIRILYSSFRNNVLLYFAIGICNAMYLHHEPECGRFPSFAKKCGWRGSMRFMP